MSATNQNGQSNSSHQTELIGVSKVLVPLIPFSTVDELVLHLKAIIEVLVLSPLNPVCCNKRYLVLG